LAVTNPAGAIAGDRVTIEPGQAWANGFGGTPVVRHFTVKVEAPFEGRLGWGFALGGRTLAMADLRSDRARDMAAGRRRCPPAGGRHAESVEIRSAPGSLPSPPIVRTRQSSRA